MKHPLAVLCVSLTASSFAPACALAAEVDARPPDRLTLSASGARQIDVDDGGGGSLNYLHYFTPNALFGIGAEHQFIADARLNFGSLRGAWSHGEPASKFTLFGEWNYGQGDDSGRDYDYSTAVLGISQALSSKFFVELESKQVDIDTTHGNLPKLGLTYLWTPRFLTYISYAYSVGGNLGTELTSGRVEYFWPGWNLKVGGATGQADPSVLVLVPGVTLPAVNSKQGFVGIGKTFSRGEVQLLGDYLETGESEKVTVTLSFTAYLGYRGPR